MPTKLFRWCNSVGWRNVKDSKPKLVVTKADVENKATSSTSCGTGPCLNGSRTLYRHSRCYRILYAQADPLMPEKSLSHHVFSQLEKALMSQFWRVNKNPYIFSIQQTLNQPCKPPPTDCRCKPSQQLAKNVAYSVVWPILVSRSLLPTQLCPCCSTKMNWPSTLLLASFQQMLIHSAQGSGKLSRYFQTRCWCTSLHLNSECRPVQGAFKTNLPEQIWVGWWWYLNDLDEIIISDVDLAS